MPNSAADLRNGTAGGGESGGGDDSIYEDFEAPKFFDFSTPEKSRPDDRYWFCARIGCDQQHEEIDPDALHKSFVLRVMEARSPNIRFQKLHDGHGGSRIPRCPRTAPAKSTKDDGVEKSSTISVIHQKIKSHPISSLRSTPITKPRMTKTPSNKNCQPCEEKTSRGVENPASTNSASTNCTTPISEMCSGMRKLQIGISNQTYRHLCRSEKSGGTRNTRLIQPKSFLYDGKNVRKTGKAENFTNKEQDDSSGMDVVDVKPNYGGRSSNVLLGKELEDDVPNWDHNSKENTPTTFVEKKITTASPCFSLIFDIANKENHELATTHEDNHEYPQKAIEAPGKTLQVIAPNGQQQVRKKIKATTNPKPFRFRTDERGVLKEANFEKKLHLNTLKETSITPQRRKYVENNTDSATWKPHKMMKLSSHSATTTHDAPKKTKEPKNTTTTTSPWKIKPSTIPKENTTTTSPWKRKPSTIPKEPRFHKIHMPKGCTKRIDKNSARV